MPRPKTKKELLSLSQKNFDALNEYVDTFSEKEQMKEFPKGTLNRNIRDVLAHLHEWHVMLQQWYEAGLQGEKPAIPAVGYTWKTLPDLNRAIWKKYSKTKIQKVRKMLDDSYTEVQAIIKKHSEKDLFAKKKFNWTGTTSLAAYLISATSSHYDWALKLIKKAKK